MQDGLPTFMSALELQHYEGWRTGLKLVDKPVPRPGPGQVLVKIAASPINPADLAFVSGRYGVRRPLPTVPGWEGSGQVVASGGGLMARFLLGRRVACAATDGNDGAWADYMVTSSRRCIPLRRSVTLEQGATLLVNPLSAWAMIELARRGRHRAMVQTAAAGALGRMLYRLSRRFGINIINIVRRPEQVELFQSLGASHILNSREPDFDENLVHLCRQLQVTLALDAVAGEMTDRLLQALPRRAQVVVYGSLSNEPCRVNPGMLIFKQQRLRGFWLSTWKPRFGMAGILYAGWQIQRLLGDELRTDFQARLPLAEAIEGIESYVSHMTGGKVLLTPGNSSVR
jgi:NADPH:quinone reductase-like Zn-dependent oxidoreductase